MSRTTEHGCVLHVAALPFPSHQGTQAAIAGMLETSVLAGRDAQLLTYATAGYAGDARFVLHRTPAFPAVSSLRSGPSLRKVVLDARMFFSLRALCDRLSPRVIVAHHVEAAMQALLLRRAPVVFFAHTDLQAELPTYGPQRAEAALGAAGALVDKTLLQRAAAIAVISPALYERFLAHAPQAAQKIAYVPTPWPVATPISRAERDKSRAELGLAADARVLLYAGNLDAYQGIDSLLLAARHAASRHAKVALLVATESEPHALRLEAARVGVKGMLKTTGLLGDEARRRVHAAADVAVVPRLAPGGLPIKLLDALSRGVPCVASPNACAGLPLTAASAMARDESAEALGEAIDALLASETRREELRAAGREYIARAHAAQRYLEAMDGVVRRAVGGESAEPSP